MTSTKKRWTYLSAGQRNVLARLVLGLQLRDLGVVSEELLVACPVDRCGLCRVLLMHRLHKIAVHMRFRRVGDVSGQQNLVFINQNGEDMSFIQIKKDNRTYIIPKGQYVQKRRLLPHEVYTLV